MTVYLRLSLFSRLSLALLASTCAYSLNTPAAHTHIYTHTHILLQLLPLVLLLALLFVACAQCTPYVRCCTYKATHIPGKVLFHVRMPAFVLVASLSEIARTHPNTHTHTYTHTHIILGLRLPHAAQCSALCLGLNTRHAAPTQTHAHPIGVHV